MTIPGHIISRYVHGSCRTFALALHDQTGWPLVVVTDYDPDDPTSSGTQRRRAGWIAPALMSPMAMHAYVQHPSGKLLDVEGLHDPAAAVEEYDAHADSGAAVLRYAAEADLRDERDEAEDADMSEVAAYAAQVLASL